MNDHNENKKSFQNLPVNIRVKLAGLWIAAMFCYIYADILGLYDKWLLGEILKGNMGPIGPITQELKLAVAILMSIPALMVLCSIMLKPKINRVANIVAGSLKTIVILLTLVLAFLTEPWAYYVYYATIEIVITVSIVWFAWNWPTDVANQQDS